MTEVLFSGDVKKATGVPMQTINEWSAAGVIPHAQTGRGTGRHRMFRVMDAVALAYGYEWRRAGLGLERVREVVACVAALDEEALREALEAGRRFVWPIPGRAVLAAAPSGVEIPESLDLGRIYETVKACLARIGRR